MNNAVSEPVEKFPFLFQYACYILHQLQLVYSILLGLPFVKTDLINKSRPCQSFAGLSVLYIFAWHKMLGGGYLRLPHWRKESKHSVRSVVL